MPSIATAIQTATPVQPTAASAPAAPTAVQSQLAPNGWVGSADNSLATVDPYNPPNAPSVITDIENLFSKFNFSITDVLRGGQNTLALGISSIANPLSDGAVISRVLGSSAITKSTLASLVNPGATMGVTGLAGTPVMGNITAAFNSGGVNPLSGQITASLGGVIQQISAASAQGLSSLGACINGLTASAGFSLNDVGAKVSLYAGLVTSAVGYGVSNAYGALTSTLGIQLQTQIAGQCLSAIISSSDVGSLLSIGLSIGMQTLAINPNTISDFSYNYTYNSTSTTSNYSTAFSQITQAYDAVDATWATYVRNTRIPDSNGIDQIVPEDCFNLSAVSKGSNDFQSVIQQGAQNSTNENDKIMLLVQVANKKTVAAQLAAQYPKTVFSGNNQLSSSTQNPISLALGTVLPTITTTYTGTTPATPSSGQAASSSQSTPITYQ